MSLLPFAVDVEAELVVDGVVEVDLAEVVEELLVDGLEVPQGHVREDKILLVPLLLYLTRITITKATILTSKNGNSMNLAKVLKLWIAFSG